MNPTIPPGFRTEPNPDVATASPPPTGQDFKALDKQVGGLVVNRWTYRLLRTGTKYLLPKLDDAGVRIEHDAEAGRGMQIAWPESVTGAGAILLIHGGGHVMGSNKEALLHAVVFARACGVPVFCPAYRLAPQDPFPAGLDDCEAGYRWLLENAGKLGVDPQRIVIGGISAGGGHAASLAQRLHDEGGVQPSAQLLVYPMLDDRTASRADVGLKQHRVWSKRNNIFGWTSYLGRPLGSVPPPYASPARRDDLSGLPPAWVGVGSADLFLDEDRDYARRLNEAGVEVTYVEVDGGIHGFDAVRESPLTTAFYASATAFGRQHTH